MKENLGAGVDSIMPYEDVEHGKTSQIERMFDTISGSYDSLNRLISLGLHHGWRRAAIKRVRHTRPETVLDIATGTADLVLEIDRQLAPQTIVGVDLSEKMLAIGREKIARHRPQSEVVLVQADCRELSYPDASFDLVTASFGVRNFEALVPCLREMRRVLKPGGRCLVLEFSQPKGLLLKAGFWLYFRTFVPFVGALLSSDRSAYRYLPKSVAAFPDGAMFAKFMRDAGFAEVEMTPLSLGICTVYVANPW